MRALLVVAVAGSVAHAETLEARWVSGENIHMAENRGAINRSRSVSISLYLNGGGKARVDEEGHWRDHFLDADNSTTEDKVVWTNAWSGTWKRSGDKLELTLTLDANACKATKTFNRSHVQPETCRPTDKKVAFACTTDTVEVEQANGKRAATKVWRCNAGTGAKLGETPGSWVFGKTRCIEIGEGRRHPISYRFCPTP